VAADVNGDGWVDLISANVSGSGTLTVLTNNRSGGFALAATLAVGTVPVQVIAADVNGDGKQDLISVNSGNNTLTVLINTSVFPLPTFTPKPTINFTGNGILVSWPSDSAGWSLQQRPDLTTGSWSPSGYNGYGISDDRTNKSMIIMPPTGNLFFRLLHP
jgi:hypothetical protein